MHTDSVQWQIEVDKKDIAYIVSIFEGYENLAVVRTLDPSRGIIELMISPDYLEDTRQLIKALAKEIPFRPLTGEEMSNSLLGRDNYSLARKSHYNLLPLLGGH